MLTGLTSWLNGSTNGNARSSLSSSSGSASAKRNNDSSSSAPSSSQTAKRTRTVVSWVRNETFPSNVTRGDQVRRFQSSDKEKVTIAFPKTWTKSDVHKWKNRFMPRGNGYNIRVEVLDRKKGQLPKARLTKIPDSSVAVATSSPPAPSPLGPSGPSPSGPTPSGPPVPSLSGPSAPLSHTKESCKDLEELSYLDASEKPLEDPFWDALEQPSDDEAGALEQPSDDEAGALEQPSDDEAGALEQPSDDEAGALEQPSDDETGFPTGPSVPSPPPASSAQQPIVEDVFEEETAKETFPDAEELFPNSSTTTNASPLPSSSTGTGAATSAATGIAIGTATGRATSAATGTATGTSPTTNASPPPSSPSPPAPSSPSLGFWASVKALGHDCLERFTTTVCEIACGIAEIPKRYQQYQERLAEEAWKIVEEVFKRGVENRPDIVGSIWDDLQEAAVMYPPVKQGFLSYFRSGIIDLEKPGRLLVSIWHYVPISSFCFTGFCMKIVAAGLMFCSPTFWLHYQCFFAVFVVAGVCQQCIEHCPLFNTAKTEMVPGRHDTKTYDENGGSKMREKATCDTIPDTPLDWKRSIEEWKKVMLAYRAGIPVFYWLLAEEFKFELLMIGYGKHVEYYVSAFFGDLLQHTRVHFESCMHTAAFFYIPRAKAIDHFVRVYVKSILFLKGEDWKDEAAVERDYSIVRDYFNFGKEFEMIPCECIELKDDETHQDGATFVFYPSIQALAKFLKVTPQVICMHLARYRSCRGVVTLGDRKFFVRYVGSVEDFPRLNGHIIYQTIVLQEVELSWVTGKGKLTKVGEMLSFPYLKKAAEFLKDNGDFETFVTARSALSDRLNGHNKLTTQDTIPARRNPKWVIGRSVEEVEFNIEDIEFYKSVRNIANRKK